MSVDFGKPVQTRDGREVIIFRTGVDNGASGHSVFGAIKNHAGWCPFSWRADGHIVWDADHCTDLINPPARFRFERWVNVYPIKESGYTFGGYANRDQANLHCDRDKRIACVKVIIEGAEGDGL